MTDIFEVAPEFTPEERRLYLGGVELSLAIQLWKESSCEEFTAGKHSFMLRIEEGHAYIACEVCEHDPLSDYDLNELIHFGPIPVDLKIRDIVYPGGPWGATEYDTQVEVTVR